MGDFRLMSRNTLIVLIAGAVSLLGACESQPKAAPKETVIWRPLGSWSGRGNVQTESFTVESGGLRVIWETRNETRPGAGTFRLSVHSAVSGRTLAEAVDHRGVGRDIAYVSDDPRVCYVVVESANLEWAFTLEEAVSATVTGTR